MAEKRTVNKLTLRQQLLVSDALGPFQADIESGALSMPELADRLTRQLGFDVTRKNAHFVATQKGFRVANPFARDPADQDAVTTLMANLESRVEAAEARAAATEVRAVNLEGALAAATERLDHVGAHVRLLLQRAGVSYVEYERLTGYNRLPARR